MYGHVDYKLSFPPFSPRSNNWRVYNMLKTPILFLKQIKSYSLTNCGHEIVYFVICWYVTKSTWALEVIENYIFWPAFLHAIFLWSCGAYFMLKNHNWLHIKCLLCNTLKVECVLFSYNNNWWHEIYFVVKPCKIT